MREEVTWCSRGQHEFVACWDDEKSRRKQYWCPPCRREYQNHRNRGQIPPETPRLFINCDVCSTDITHRYKSARYCSEKCRRKPAGRYWRSGWLMRKYGITIEDYDRMLAEQGGGCGICGQPPGEGGLLDVDHCHATGRVRGLLCSRHNRALGGFDDNSDYLRAASEYLLRDLARSE